MKTKQENAASLAFLKTKVNRSMVNVMMTVDLLGTILNTDMLCTQYYGSGNWGFWIIQEPGNEESDEDSGIVNNPSELDCLRMLMEWSSGAFGEDEVDAICLALKKTVAERKRLLAKLDDEKPMMAAHWWCSKRIKQLEKNPDAEWVAPARIPFVN